MSNTVTITDLADANESTKSSTNPFSGEGNTLGDGNKKYCSDFTNSRACARSRQGCKWDNKIDKCVPISRQILLNSITQASQQRLIQNFISRLGPSNIIDRPSSVPGSSEKTGAPSTLIRSRSSGNSPDPNSPDIQITLDNLAELEQKFLDDSDSEFSDNSDFESSDDEESKEEKKTSSSSNEDSITAADLEVYVEDLETLSNDPSMWEHLREFGSRFVPGLFSQLLSFMNELRRYAGDLVRPAVEGLIKAIFGLLKALIKGGEYIVIALNTLGSAFGSLINILIEIIPELAISLLNLLLSIFELLYVYVLEPLMRYTPELVEVIYVFLGDTFRNFMRVLDDISTQEGERKTREEGGGGSARVEHEMENVRRRLRNSPLVRTLLESGTVTEEELRQTHPHYFKGSVYKKSFMGGRKKSRRKTKRKSKRKSKIKSRKKRKSRRKSRR